MKKRVPYGIANYAELVEKNAYFIDKTSHIETLESIENPAFLRPRHFGKSLFCSILQYYYDVNSADQFDELFGHTWIGQHPTKQHNQHLVLSLDFSCIEPGGTIKDVEHSFQRYCNPILEMSRLQYPPFLAEMPTMPVDESVAANLSTLLRFISVSHAPQLYVIIDEYDNFSNQLITAHKDEKYRGITADDSFLKTFFKVLKEGRKTGSVANVFITGVLPITLDDLASGFNIASFLTLHPTFENMLGFTQTEVDALLDEIWNDYAIDPGIRREVDDVIRNQYNGYHFVSTDGEALYNSTILMFFLRDFCEFKAIPEYLIDMNLRTDLSWVRRITGANPANTEEFVGHLTTQNRIAYDRKFLVTQFSMSQFFEKSFYPISFFYLGMLTKQDPFFLRLPNLNMRKIFVEYFNELHHIDVSTKYADLMQGFVNHPDLFELFTGYWKLYVSQLPEVIFQQVNENFYRTTFYELCSRYLSTWFTWNVERSYPKGRSDLEFVGKYHEKFAGLRWVIEFKYYSNTVFRKMFGTSIEAFQLQTEDTEQIAGYVEGLRKEYPEARISQFVIYCIGNKGFRVFRVDN